MDAAGTKLPSQDRWKWFELVGDKRFEDARGAVGVLMRQGETGVGLVIGLASHLLRLGVAVGGGARDLEAVLPKHQQWLAGRIGAQARKWTMSEIDYAVDGLLKVDQLLKASPHTDEHFLEIWLLSQRALGEAA